MADAATLARLEGEGRVVFRYAGANPERLAAAIAGISSADGRVVGLMPHPEHAIEPLTGPTTDGLGLFRSSSSPRRPTAGRGFLRGRARPLGPTARCAAYGSRPAASRTLSRPAGPAWEDDRCHSRTVPGRPAACCSWRTTPATSSSCVSCWPRSTRTCELIVAGSLDRGRCDRGVLAGCDCVLLDLNLPGTTGLDGLRASCGPTPRRGLRAHRPRRRAPRHRGGRRRRAGLPGQGQGRRRGADPRHPLRGGAPPRREQPVAAARGAARRGGVGAPGARPAALAAAGRQPGRAPARSTAPAGPAR